MIEKMNVEIHNLCSSSSRLSVVLKSRRMKWVGHVLRTGEIRSACIFVGQPKGMERDNLGALGKDGKLTSDWILKNQNLRVQTQLAHYRIQWRDLVNTRMNLRIP
jgi:hypothetical protein